MKTIATLFFFTLTLISCSRNASNKELLTSTDWKLTSNSADSSAQETIKFLKDGTYVLEAGELKVNGAWSWKSDDEIYLIVDGLTSDNGAAKFDKTSNYNIRIKEISNNSLQILEKAEGDSWDGGFAKEKNYVSSKK